MPTMITDDQRWLKALAAGEWDFHFMYRAARILSELEERAQRIANLEAQLAAASKPDAVQRLEQVATSLLADPDLRTAVAEQLAKSRKPSAAVRELVKANRTIFTKLEPDCELERILAAVEKEIAAVDKEE